MPENKPKIGVVVSTALSITIIVGAGLLVLPGLSFAKAGKYGYVPWILVAIAMLPLLHIFAFFGRTYPSAGGVVGYVRASVGNRWATVCETIILGTFTLGVPAIALIGSQYLNQSYPEIGITTIALATITIAFIAGMIGLRVSGALQTGIAVLIVAGLVTIGFGFLSTASLTNNSEEFVTIDINVIKNILLSIPLILFAFTGWEMTAFLAEDMENPKRDMPTSIWASFVIVTGLYVFVAWLVASYGESNSNWQLAPVTQMAKGWLGNDGSKWVGIIATLLVVANVVAAFFSVSRAMFSAGRDGILPTILSKTNRKQEPIFAMLITYAIFFIVIVSNHFGFLTVDNLLQLAGQNFFVLYLLAAVGYWQLHKGHFIQRIIAVTAIFLVLNMILLFSLTGLLYCLSLTSFGLWLGRAQKQHQPPQPDPRAA